MNYKEAVTKISELENNYEVPRWVKEALLIALDARTEETCQYCKLLGEILEGLTKSPLGDVETYKAGVYQATNPTSRKVRE